MYLSPVRPVWGEETSWLSEKEQEQEADETTTQSRQDMRYDTALLSTNTYLYTVYLPN